MKSTLETNVIENCNNSSKSWCSTARTRYRGWNPIKFYMDAHEASTLLPKVDNFYYVNGYQAHSSFLIFWKRSWMYHTWYVCNLYSQFLFQITHFILVMTLVTVSETFSCWSTFMHTNCTTWTRLTFGTACTSQILDKHSYVKTYVYMNT